MTTGPSDEELGRTLATAGEDVRRAFAQAVDALEEAVSAGEVLVEWHGGAKTAEGHFTFPWPAYDDRIRRVLITASELLEAAGFDDLWLESLPSGPEAIERGSLLGAASFLVTIQHRERISTGLIEACLESGALLAASRRLRTAVSPAD
jgi:hypothetical protein